VLSRGSAVNPVLFERLVEVAGREGIPYSIEAVPSRTSTDADSIFTARMGIATALVSVPNRYMHTPNEMVALEDLERAADLIAATVRTLSAIEDFVPS
jgi:endoglucanase